MRNALLYVALAALIPAMGIGATRIYQVEPHNNYNGWTEVNQYVTQTFVCTADSLLWAEFFVGAANSGGQYEFAVRDDPNGSVIYTGKSDTCNPNMHYMFVRANLARQTNDALVKGKTYYLKVTHSAGDPFNFYYSPWDPYTYGIISVPGGSFSPPPQVYSPDLSARIEGINRPMSRDFFGALRRFVWVKRCLAIL
jgi:hypothetical protein